MSKLLEEEKLLLKRISCGDELAFQKIFYRYKDKLFTYCLKLTKSDTLAEEIVNDVFMKVWMHRSNINVDLSFNAYLFKITRNLTIDFLNKISKEAVLRKELLYYADRSYNHTEDYILNVEYDSLMKTAIDRLPRQKKIIFNLSRAEGLTYEDIAGQLGLSKNTVKNHMIEALKSIKKYLQMNSDISCSISLICFFGRLF